MRALSPILALQHADRVSSLIHKYEFFGASFAAFLLLTSVIACRTSSANAADISVMPGKVCHLLFAGTIERGDAERLQKSIAEERDKISARIESGDPAEPAGSGTPTPRFVAEEETVSLCLNSSGGDYAEALKFVEFMLNSGGIATVIDAEHECLSACALIFMFGHIEAYHEDKYFDRRLHVRGKLGFHAPYLKPPLLKGSRYPFEEVAKTYREGIRAFGRLLELDRNEFLARGLTIAFMKIRPNDFLYVDTVDRAGEWTIELFGDSQVNSVTERMVTQACDNEENWEERRKSREFNISRFVEKKRPAERTIRMVEDRFQLFLPGYGAEGGGFCAVRLQQFRDKSLAMEVTIEADPTKIEEMKAEHDFALQSGRMLVEPGFGARKPLWFIYPPDTKLIGLSQGAR